MTANRPRVLFAYRYGVLGGVAIQLMHRASWAGPSLEMRVVFEEDHGAAGLFPEGVAFYAADHEERVRLIGDIRPDVMVVIDSPAFIPAWEEAGSPGALAIEVHTTTENFSYLDDLPPDLPVAALVTVSDYMASRVRETVIGRAHQVFVVPNSLGLEWFREVPPVEIGGRPIMWVGKLDGHKRFMSALDLLEACVRAGPDDTWPLLVGGYTARRDRVAYLLAAMSNQPGLRRGRWWPWVGYESMPTLYRSVAGAGGLLVLTTRDESFGMTVAEAVLMGCPVVAPAVGALPELLPPEAMYRPGSLEDAQTLVHRVLTDQGFARRLVDASSPGVAQKVHPDRSRDAYLALLGRLLAAA